MTIHNLKTEVAGAIDEIECHFSQCRVEKYPDGEGGAKVVVNGIPMGAPYKQSEIWLGFHITSQYPYADIYPHFTNAELSKQDGTTLGSGFADGEFMNQKTIQISRRSKKWNPLIDTASLKLKKVISWLKDQK